MGNIRKGIKENPDLSKHKTIFDPSYKIYLFLINYKKFQKVKFVQIAQKKMSL